MATTAPDIAWIDLRRENAEAYRALAALTRAGHMEPTTLELLKIRASLLNGCGHCMRGHVAIALRGGEEQERIDALGDWRDSGLFTDRERAALALTDAMTLLSVEGPPPAGVVAEAADAFPGEELARLIVAITGINAWNRVALATALGRGDEM